MPHESLANLAHQALNADLQALMARYQSMPVIERVAVLSQLIGAEIATVPNNWTSGEVMQTVALNIAAGNSAPPALLVSKTED